MKAFRNVMSGLIPAVYFYAVFAGAVAAGEAVWQTNFPAAQAKAKAEKKFLLTAFTGSDWCPWCKKLKTEIFDKKPFAAQASKQFILVDIDFPHEKKLPDELKAQNARLQKQYGIYTYPSVLILKPTGELIAHTGYSSGGPENYIKQLADLMTTYESLAGLRTQLPQAEGLDRAKLLDQLIEAYNKLGHEIADIDGWRREIVALDSDNKAGLRHKYEFRIYLLDAQKALANARPAKAEAAIDKALALKDLGPVQIQRAAIVKAKCFLARKDYQASVDCLENALKAAPKSSVADELKDLLNRSKKTLESQRSQESGGKAVTQVKR